MAADGRFGGHLVSGHIDAVGTIRRIQRDDNAVWYTIGADATTLRHIIMKGSIAIGRRQPHGGAPDRRRLRRVHHPPHPGRDDPFLKRVGDEVNLETDMVGKYVERFLGAPLPPPSATVESGGITQAFLTAHGF